MPGPGCGGREMNYTATIRDPLPSHTHQSELFELSFEEEPGGSRPDRLSGPQQQVLRRTVQQIVDLVPFLDHPAPQMVDQLQDIMRFFDTLLPDPERDFAFMFFHFPFLFPFWFLS